MNVGIYCRISKDRDGGGLGVARQESDCRKLCGERGWEVAEVYVDNDISATSGVRPAFLRMLRDVKNGRLGAVVAYHNDRLLRSPRELEDFIDVIDAAGAEVATVMGGAYDLSTGTGKMSARIVGAVARAEADRMGERLRRKHLELAESGRPSGGGHRAYGYDPTGLQVVPDEAERLREAARRVLAGESLRGVCGDWNARGVTTAQGSQWRTPNLRRLLLAPRTAGKREHRGEIVGDAAWPAVLDTSTWTRLRLILADPTRGGPGGNPRTYLLSGLAYCALCERKLVAHPAVKRSYACRATPGTGGCGGVRILADWLEGWVVEQMLNRVDTVTEPAQDIEPLLTQASTLEARMVELASDYYADRTISRAQFTSASTRLRKQLEVVEHQLRAVAPQPSTMDLRKRWDSEPFAVKRAAVEGLIDRVTVTRSATRGSVFDPDRVHILFKRY